MERSARSRSMSHGHVAAATSTGGLTAKRWGRIGDSPLIGAGTYADDRSAAVSATGSGEYFIRAVAAHEVAARVRLGGESLQAGARRRARRDQGAGRQRRADRRRAVGRGGLGLHHRRHVPRHGRRRTAAGSRSMPTRIGAVGQRRAQPIPASAAIASRSPLEEVGDRAAEARIGDEMRRAGDHRLIAARQLVLALRAGLDRRQAMLDRPFDRLVIAQLEMEERHLPRPRPNSGRRACRGR